MVVLNLMESWKGASLELHLLLDGLKAKKMVHDYLLVLCLVFLMVNLTLTGVEKGEVRELC